jgi:hypothetical protein
MTICDGVRVDLERKGSDERDRGEGDDGEFVGKRGGVGNG